MDIGFYLIDADHSEKCNAIIDTINNMVDSHPYDNIILFNNQYNRIDNNNKKFPILHINQAKYFDGYLLVFDTKSTIISKTFPAPKKQFLYVDEASWSKDGSIPVLFWHSIFLNPNIILIASNESIKDLLTLCWDPPVSIMPNINAKDLYESILQLQ